MCGINYWLFTIERWNQVKWILDNSLKIGWKKFLLGGENIAVPLEVAIFLE
jgi:hypothetical protein